MEGRPAGLAEDFIEKLVSRTKEGMDHFFATQCSASAGRENPGKSWLCGKHHGMGGNVLPSTSLKSILDIKSCQEDLGTHPAI